MNRIYSLTALLVLLQVWRSVSAPAAVVLSFGPAQQNRGADDYQFAALVSNEMATEVRIESFNLPFDLGGDNDFSVAGSDQGFRFNTLRVEDSDDTDGRFSSTSVNTTNPFFDVLLGATAVGDDTGLVLTPGESKKLFTLVLTSDGSVPGAVNAAELIRNPPGSQFGQFVVDGENIFNTDLQVSDSGFTVAAVPEPSSLIAIFVAGSGIVAGRRKRRCDITG